jgi:hypothetical protein
MTHGIRKPLSQERTGFFVGWKTELKARYRKKWVSGFREGQAILTTAEDNPCLHQAGAYLLSLIYVALLGAEKYQGHFT